MSLSKLIQKGGLRGLATATPATVATDRLCITPIVATVATVNVAIAQNIAANDPPAQTKSQVSAKVAATPADPDRWCWPHGQAMNTAEIETFTARLARFTDKGLTLSAAEALADGLVQRDREMDDRRLCVECVHLHGSANRWRCSEPVAAGIGLWTVDAHLPSELVHKPQGCAGFNDFRLRRDCL